MSDPAKLYAYALRGMISQMNVDYKNRVDECYESLKAKAAEYGETGKIALYLLCCDMSDGS